MTDPRTAPATSLARTYRYVRLSILGAVLALLVAVVVVAVAAGAAPTSLSAAFYTPARTVFTGALFAVSLALLALSGRSVPQALLDVAAVLAPLIAIIPTPVVPGDAPGAALECPTREPCVPEVVFADTRTGMITFVVVTAVALVTALLLARAQRSLSRGVVVTVSAVGVIAAGFAVWSVAGWSSFLLLAHLVATLGFFALVGVVAGWAAWAAPAARVGSSAPFSRAWYGALALGIVAGLAFLLVVFVLRVAGVDLVAVTGLPLILIGEVVLLLLFAGFWILESVRTWDDPDPTLR